MVQSWNQLCFTQGKLVISARLANKGTVSGLWPGIWTMGNLGRPGYLASTEGYGHIRMTLVILVSLLTNHHPTVFHIYPGKD